eukprot:CAMPEP_0183727400 /NCGR_PEP_ID=MMETSP0737-20130205/25641_1 /TAXON_ID=385413 /ORGANISM="Thalassiosira miniscula, Strain CCMP1093" /LENGTH=31 /DNA_ID= /DNA_START= /DNA_END= /DNA_ORIENTATION=
MTGGMECGTNFPIGAANFLLLGNFFASERSI